MNQYFISLFIDNELSLDEKIDFIQTVYGNRAFRDEAVSFLEQEKMLAATLNREVPASAPPSPKLRLFSSWPRAATMAAAACLLIVMAYMAGRNYPAGTLPAPQTASAEQTTVKHRFVIYRQGSDSVEITGSFTDWLRIPLRPVGKTGYWEISFDLPPGEYRYSYILNNEEVLPDPTVTKRETDDFGSVNSILSVEA